MSANRSLKGARALPLLLALLALVAPALVVASGSASAARVSRATAESMSGAERREARVLSNGCSYSSRGIPSCGALMGAAYGANTDPSGWEKSMGHRLGVRRTYFSPRQVDSAVRKAKEDHARNRLPWMSFKLPYSWADMAKGRGDAWTRDLARKMSRLDGPVWLAFHHEPEGDGDIKMWKRMQERLGPIVRNNASNVGFSVVLTGWNQLYGPSQYRLRTMWPNTKVDIAGFDVYNHYGIVKNGKRFDRRTMMKRDYFRKFQAFANERNMAWGLAETAHNDESFRDDPRWVKRTYRAMRKTGGVAFAYFNTHLHSMSSWRLGNGAKEDAYARVLRTTPTL